MKKILIFLTLMVSLSSCLILPYGGRNFGYGRGHYYRQPFNPHRHYNPYPMFRPYGRRF